MRNELHRDLRSPPDHASLHPELDTEVELLVRSQKADGLENAVAEVSPDIGQLRALFVHGDGPGVTR
jgi:hypothetical protein